MAESDKYVQLPYTQYTAVALICRLIALLMNIYPGGQGSQERPPIMCTLYICHIQMH